MTGSELIVVIAGLIIGYWGVARFGSNRKTHEHKAHHSDSDPKSAYRNAHTSAGVEQEETQHAESTGQAPWPTILGVAPDASTEEIRRAYKSLMSQYHPDKVASLGPELRDLCERKTKEINTAYDQAIAEKRFG